MNREKNLPEGIPGFRVYDERNQLLADNPKKEHTKGRRVYDENGQRVWAVDKGERVKTKYHSYLIRIPHGLWKAFTMKCERNDVNRMQAIRTLVKLWVNGTIDLDIRLYVK
ncbi:MAG: hypothetical protein DRQ56_03560 [Gammaproteobacteria bacterium]|nr:MAG: hypothetical protein DRQ56_03560 [Gammaproteobacteria bacterium]